jgi:4-amino-4-deoxy-L-arabinose transferase-like glycosyltransferase
LRRNGNRWLSARCRCATSRPNLALGAIVIVFVVITSTIALQTPAWESPDEPSHVENVETLVAGHWYRIPTGSRIRSANVPISFELHQPPLYYLLLAGFQRLVGEPPHSVRPGPATFAAIFGGLYLHHSAAQHRFVLLLRFPNVFLGVLTILFTFLTVRSLTGDPWSPIVAAALVAFLPAFVFSSSFVTNDNLVNTLGGALAYALVRAIKSPTTARAAIVGVIIGLLVITKLSALTAVAVMIPLAYTKRGLVSRAWTIACAGIAAVIICGWYLLQNDLRYGDPLAATATKHYLTPIGGVGTFGAPYVIVHPLRLMLLQVPVRIANQFPHFSQLATVWPVPVIVGFWLSLGVALLGLRGWSTRNNRSGQPSRRALVALAVLAGAGFLSVWLVALNTASYRGTLAALGWPSLACLVALGLERWKLALRLVIPLVCFCGTLVALQQDALGVHWFH